MSYPVAYRDKPRTRSKPLPSSLDAGRLSRDRVGTGLEEPRRSYPGAGGSGYYKHNRGGRRIGEPSVDPADAQRRYDKYVTKRDNVPKPGIVSVPNTRTPRPAPGVNTKGLKKLLGRAARIGHAAEVVEHILNLPKKDAKYNVPAGWQKCPGPACGGPEQAKTIQRNYNPSFPNNYSVCGASVGCLTLQSISGYTSVETAISPTVLAFQTWTVHPTIANRGSTAGQYVKTGPYQSGHPMPVWQKARAPSYARSDSRVQPLVIADPFLHPIGVPVATPKPLPYEVVPHRSPNPGRAPSERTESGYSTPRLGIGVGTVLDTAPGVRPRTPGAQHDPTTRTPTVIETAPGVRPRPGPPPPAHQAKRPGKRTKEKKLIMGLTGKVAKVVNIFTEGADLVEALHKALPKKYQAKRNTVVDPKTGKTFTVPPRPDQQALAMYRNSDKMDWAKALGNVIKMEAGDRFAGSIGKATAKANRKASNATGIRIQIGLGPAL